MLRAAGKQHSRKVTSADAVNISDRDCVECLCSYIDDNLSSDLSTKTLCDIAHVSEGKMISAFRNVQGDTPQSYIRARRLEHGRRLLLDGSRKLVGHLILPVDDKHMTDRSLKGGQPV